MFFRNLEQMEQNGKNSQCPYFRKITFKKMQLLNSGTDTYRQQDPFQDQDQSFSTFRICKQQNIPFEGSKNEVKVHSYNFSEKYKKLTADTFNKQNIQQQIIKIKMPKVFQSRSLCQKHKSKFNMKCNDKINNKNQPQIQQTPIENNIDIQKQKKQLLNKNISDQQIINQGYIQKSFSSIVILIECGKQIQCSLFINKKFLKISSQHQKFSEMQHINFFVPLDKYKLFINRSQQIIVNIGVRCKNKLPEISLKFLDRQSLQNFMTFYQSRNNSINLTNDQLLSCNSLCSLDSFQFAVERESVDTIEKNLRNFDIVLLKGKSFMSKFQRFFTNSHFDHVGLILKTFDGQSLIFQATGNVGVAIYSFNSVKKALEHGFYEKAAIRKLKNSSFNWEKNQFIEKLQKFVRKANGIQYKFDPMYLVWPQNKANNRQSEQYKKQIGQTYFCSQLIADALRFCSIMKNNPKRPSCSFLPKHFAEIQKLNEQLENGFSYSQLIIVS